MNFQSLDDWLRYLETLHPRAIELGLERLRAVQARLGLDRVACPVITVGGTNGKGSTVAMLEAILDAAGYKVGAYTSPHLLRFNERVRVGREQADDAALMQAFARVEAARGEVSLTYFEFTTLAAMLLFQSIEQDVLVLEVGLGGRLDAVNAWDADVAVVASVGIDHTDWLGPDRESIGREKAGIFRAGRAAICGDPDPPASLIEGARAAGARLLRLGVDFSVERQGATGWSWRGAGRTRAGLPYPALRGDYQLHNAACALMALDCLGARLPVSQAQVRAGLLAAQPPGRFQTLPGTPLCVLDVAHNADAARALAATLTQQTVAGHTFAVVGMLKDKAIEDVVAALVPVVDAWFLAGLATARGASADELAARAARAGVTQAQRFDDVDAAYRAARAQAGPSDRIVVLGSFYTVGAILRALEAHDRVNPHVR